MNNNQTEIEKNAGLIFGYVQSGKSLSFTCVSALANDNGYKLIIVFTGIDVGLKVVFFKDLFNT